MKSRVKVTNLGLSPTGGVVATVQQTGEEKNGLLAPGMYQPLNLPEGVDLKLGQEFELSLTPAK